MMASLKQIILLCGLISISCKISTNSLKIDIEPALIPEDYNGNLTITCDARDVNMTLATFLQLRKTTDVDDDVPVLEIFPGTVLFVDPAMKQRAHAEGDLDVSNGVYLSMTLYQVTEADFGNYSCDLSYVAIDDHKPHFAIVNGTVEGVIPKVDIEPPIESCQNATTLPTTSLENITNEIMDLKQEIENLKNMTASTACCNENNSGTAASEAVAFTYRVFGSGSEVAFDNNVVPFTVPLLDTHKILNEVAHSITIPKSGIYEISLTMVAGPSSVNGFEADLTVNFVPKAILIVDNTSSSSLTVLLKLIQGQELKVTGKGDPLFVQPFTYISGHLVSEL